MTTDCLAGARRVDVRKWLALLLDLVYPPHCLACRRPGAWLCSSCAESISFLQAPVCHHCGTPIRQAGLCPSCQHRQSDLMGVRSVAFHLSPLREAVHALKYEGMRVLAEPLGEILAQYWPSADLMVSVVVPVPLHTERLRQRGYNQSLLLATALGKRVGLPVEQHVLVRSRNTPSQVGLSIDERWANVRDAFRCSSDALSGERVLLIDDVYTTGATLETCASALLESGAAEVWALTLVRAVGSGAMIPGPKASAPHGPAG